MKIVEIITMLSMDDSKDDSKSTMTLCLLMLVYKKAPVMSLSLIFIQEYHQSFFHISCNIIRAYKPQVKPHTMSYTRDENFNIMTRIPEPATQVLKLLCDMDVLLPTLALDFPAARIFRTHPKTSGLKS